MFGIDSQGPFQGDNAFPYDAMALAKRFREPETEGRLRRFRGRLEVLEVFDAESVDKTLHAFVDSEGIKVGQIIHAVRVAVTGKGMGFGLFEAMAILGRNSCLARIDRVLAVLHSNERVS